MSWTCSSRQGRISNWFVTHATLHDVTSATEDLGWILLSYRLPPEPSRHRVAVWRELRKVGAIPLQQATWVLPAKREYVEAVDRAVALVERGGGDALVLDVTGRGEPARARLEELYTDAREAEWLEFLSECAKFEAEIAKEIRIGKFTPAELDEEEQSLSRLRIWFRELRGRDLFIAPSQEPAERGLKACVEALEDFAERVYEEGEKT
jgi:sugar phosphate isomerase/epimerase